MNIVLNEYEWAENAIKTKDIGRKPSETLTRIAKYYFANKYNKREVRALLDQFMVQCDPHVSLPLWSAMLDRVVRNASRFEMINVDCVRITVTELSTIQKIKSQVVRRLAFTLLCVAKYWNSVSPSNNHWVNTSDSDIMKMANIKVSVKRQSEMFGALNDMGLIKFSKKVDNLNVQVLFSDDGMTEMRIKDFRNLGYQYEWHYGGKFFECNNCGVVVKAPDDSSSYKRKKYCDACAAEVKMRQSVNAVMRARKAKLLS